MQLFSMGLYQLHDNGTRITNDEGEPLLAYDIEDVASLSAGWTGFNKQSPRANMEQTILHTQSTSDGISYFNAIDPMYINGKYRDTNPKRTPTRGYIGDGSPLCVDLPKQAFLKTGAHYRYRGSNSNYDKLMGHESRGYGEYGEASTANFDLSTDSALYKKLCGAAVGPCDFKSIITLQDNLSCHGSECDLDEVRVIKLANAGTKENGERYNVFYEYVRQPCVHHSFFASPTVITSGFGLQNHPELGNKFYHPMRVNPRTMAAESACCSKTPDGKTYRMRNYHLDSDNEWQRVVEFLPAKTATCDFKFTNEHVTYATAESRCEARGEELCDFERLDAPAGCETEFAQFWRPGNCNILAQITLEGQVTIVDDIPNMGGKNFPENAFDSDDTFRVVWADDNFPVVETGCGGGACTVRGKTCVCSTKLSDEAVFATLPSSRAEVISELTVGAIDPATLDSGTYEVGAQSSEVTAYFLKSRPGFNTDAIIEIKDYSKNSKPRFLKNLRSIVFMGDESTGFSFLNPVSFHSKYERTTRDAEHETDAILDYYFHHKNVPPFFANTMIQRFVTSNPSPRYVRPLPLHSKLARIAPSAAATEATLLLPSRLYCSTKKLNRP
jgi:hypothetical protein